MTLESNKPLKICLISYRSNPHCGGQGVYIRNLSRALRGLGHHVDVVAGPPAPKLSEGIGLHMLETLDLYNPDNLFRTPDARELLDPVNLLEWLSVCTMGYPEPFTFGFRAHAFLSRDWRRYDIVHDNQSLSYGLWAISKKIPTVATIHHPITRDRDIAVASTKNLWKKLQHRRWYSFIGMQKRVSRTLAKIITVSECSRRDISLDFKVAERKFTVVPNGIDTDIFHPLPHLPREKNRLIVTNSADTPLKGLYYLLQAVAIMAEKREIFLTVIGTPKKNGGIEKLISRLCIGHLVTFTGRVDNDEFVRQYARASVAVVPSVYEGFGLPVGEAMACGVPVVSTTGGALPEVAGDAAMLVPPKDPEALAGAIEELLDNPERANALGKAGYERIMRGFTWEKAAEKTVQTYREVIRDHR